MPCPHISSIASIISGGDLYFCDCPTRETTYYTPTKAERQAYCLTERQYKNCMFYEQAYPHRKHI